MGDPRFKAGASYNVGTCTAGGFDSRSGTCGNFTSKIQSYCDVSASFDDFEPGPLEIWLTLEIYRPLILIAAMAAMLLRTKDTLPSTDPRHWPLSTASCKCTKEIGKKKKSQSFSSHCIYFWEKWHPQTML